MNLRELVLELCRGQPGLIQWHTATCYS